MSGWKDVFHRALVFHRLPVIYVPVPEAACASIKNYLFRQEGVRLAHPSAVHAIQVPGLDGLANLSALRFSEIALNPGTR